MTLACTFSSDPPSLIEWSKAGQVLTNTTHQLTVREFGHNTRTSILEIRSVNPASRGLYQCRAFNKGGQAVDSRSLVVVDHDIMEELVRVKLYVTAGVGLCIVLLSSLIAASCIYHVRSKETLLQSCKFSRQQTGSWCDSDSGDFTSDSRLDSRPLFRFSLRDRNVCGKRRGCWCCD